MAFQVPKISTARFEDVVVGIEQKDDMVAAIDTVEEALGVLNVRFLLLYLGLTLTCGSSIYFSASLSPSSASTKL